MKANGLIDIHAHILPGLDDGPASLDEAIALLRLLIADQVRTVIATPHVAPGFFWPYNAQIMQNKLIELRQAAEQERLEIEIVGGAEIYLSPEVGIMAGERKLPTLGNSEYVLVEFPRHEVPVWALGVLKKIQKADYKPILAHPELNVGVRNDRELVKDLHRMGVLLQVDASSITGRWGKAVRDFALNIIKDGIVFAVASDAHSPQRPPELSEAKRILGEGFPKADLNIGDF